MSALIEIEEKLFIAPEALYLVKDEGKEFVERSLNSWDDSENDNWNDSEDSFEDNNDEVLDSAYNGIAIENIYSYTQDSDVNDQLVIKMFEAGLLAIREDNYDNNYDISFVALFDLTHQIDNDTYYLGIDYFYKEILVELSANEGIIPKFIYVDSPYSNDVIVALPLSNITDAYWHDIDKLSIRIETCSDKEYIAYYEYELEDGKVIEQFNEFKSLGFSIDDEGYGIER